MSKKCELTGKIPMKGHNVSHANNKTKRRFIPNLKKIKFTSELLKRSLKLTVSNAGVRSVDKRGSFDEYLKLKNEKNKTSEISVNNFVDETINIKVKDYYFSNVIARSSKTMVECNNSKIEIKKTGTEG